jgi:NAD(P)-dependent dehydrogenase (short-subunit alcohol dehydrogenase family)
MHVVITGANRGIGLSLCKAYKEAGAEVTGVCRSVTDDLTALDINVVNEVDVTSAQDLVKLSNSLQGRAVDVLINNAGVLRSESIGAMDYNDIQLQFDVNTLGPLKTTLALLPLLKQGSKVANITSRMGSIADNGSGGYYGYRMSKAALNIASVSLAKDLLPKGVAVGIIHPGFVQTDMVGGAGDISADTAASRIKTRIDELTLETSGTFWHSNGEVLPW